MRLAELGGARLPRGSSPRLPPPVTKLAAALKSAACRACLSGASLLLFLLIFIVLAVLAAAMVFIDPKVPSYSVTDFDVINFNVSSDLTLHARLNITIRTENGNKKIGITYLEDSNVRLVYRSTDLCSGKLPSFFQDHENVTVMSIMMEGSVKLSTEVEESLEEDKMKGDVPLEVFVKVPVKLRVFDVDTVSFSISVRCDLVLDDLQPGKKVTIKSTKYTALW
ncbi:uncharacterized protein A4U43_C01F35190 [Asparagus officinalis]|uniref:Uncharacterized protein n=1 Tax=Asparagus officinalis TaxID=4686 RepID=A0A5P1FX31_ASPOF|nr:NDR1/HIN1-like protein 13 [Asparagus officinalis]ONK82009.1 uncharacterized protein A4U43_C01F35190 [Asparagus officinalis]